MFFYGCQCYMKKHGIADYIPNNPSDEEDEVELNDGVSQEKGSRATDGSTTTSHKD